MLSRFVYIFVVACLPACLKFGLLMLALNLKAMGIFGRPSVYTYVCACVSECQCTITKLSLSNCNIVYIWLSEKCDRRRPHRHRRCTRTVYELCY